MSLGEIVMEGTLKPDGTLQLDDRPNLAPGRVQVIVRSLSASSTGQRGLVEVMDEIRRSQRARGYQGRTAEEMQTEEKVRQEEDEAYERRCEQVVIGA